MSSYYLSSTKPNLTRLYTGSGFELAVQWLRLTLSNGHNRLGVPWFHALETETYPVSKTWTKSKTSKILIAIHRRLKYIEFRDVSVSAVRITQSVYSQY
jgi:hypothetical protein